MDGSDPTRRASALERQAALAIGALLTAGVVWMANGVAETTASVAALRVQIEALREQIAELKEGGRFTFPAAEARREFGRVDGRLADLELRLRQMELRVPEGRE
ncbi:hypothetical protein L2U69_12490 [Zavarzinia compransoris]|uniref:hypothetical protein n=1 Tax=Zavarzinia marina TaxID=2911065 RepID=UPI001F184885|nr:hypothetical protein [Zavarzinia marina]MCF4166464.1 hypothetical protein [Zavarzinia marina]